MPQQTIKVMVFSIIINSGTGMLF